MSVAPISARTVIERSTKKARREFSEEELERAADATVNQLVPSILRKIRALAEHDKYDFTLDLTFEANGKLRNFTQVLNLEAPIRPIDVLMALRRRPEFVDYVIKHFRAAFLSTDDYHFTLAHVEFRVLCLDGKLPRELLELVFTFLK